MRADGLVNRIKKSELKAKELSILLAKEIVENRELLGGLEDEFSLLTDVEKGILMEALKLATNVDPEIVEPVVGVVLECLICEAPKVKWEAARVIGNIAEDFPKVASSAIPRLLENARHKGTVVRWSAAYALSEIARHDRKARRRLLPEINVILKKEKNSGVKNVYLKALKTVP